MRSDLFESDGQKARDADAAREAFRQFQLTREPQALARVFDLVAQEMLLVAHHLARRGVSAEDLLQSALLDAIRAADTYDASRPLMPWLCGILVNVARSQNRAQSREYEAWRVSEPTIEDPADLAVAREFADALREAIAEFPSPQRDVLTLRLVHGLTPTEIAHALGHPAGSVKSWIHRGVERLRYALPPAFGAALARFAQAAPSLAEQRVRLLEAASPWLVSPEPVPAPTAPALGARTAGLWGALALTLISCWIAWRAFTSSELESSAPAVASDSGASAERSADGRASRRETQVAVDREPDLADGALEISAHYAADGAPAELALRLTPRWGADPSFRSIALRTDAAGAARVEGLARGEWSLEADRGAPLSILLGPQGAHVSLAIAAGVHVRGRAVDEHGATIAGARVWLSAPSSFNDGQYATTTGADGRFELRDVPALRALAVHAAGFAPSTLQLAGSVEADGGLFKLSRERRELRGRVVSARGDALAGARLLIGPLVEPGSLETLQEGHALVAPLSVECDERGEFACDWWPPPWSARVRARAPGLCPAQSDGALDEPLRIELSAGATWRGALDAPSLASGAVAVKAESLVAAAQAPDWLSPRWIGSTGAAFELSGIGAGAIVLTATDSAGRSCSTLAPPPLEGVVDWSPNCGGAAPLHGVVRRLGGEPIEGAQVEALRLGASRLIATSDEEGRFAFDDLGAGGATLITRITPDGAVIDRRVGVRGSDEQLEIAAPIERLPTAFIVLGARDSTGRELGEVYVLSFSKPMPAAVERLSDGLLRVGPLPAGSHHLVVQGESDEVLHLGPFDLQPFEEFAAGEHVSQPPGQVQLEVADLPQADRGSVAASLLTRDGACLMTFFKIKEGIGTCMPTAPGEWRLRLSFPHSGMFDASAQVVSGAVTRLELEAPKGAPVTFVVRDEALDETLALRESIEQLDSGLVTPSAPLLRRSPGDGARRMTRNLASGRYRIQLSDGFALRGEAVFAVGAARERVEVIVELR